MSTLPDGWYWAIKDKIIVVVHIEKGNHGIIGRLASPSEFKDYQFIPFDKSSMVEYAKLLNKLW